MTLIHWLRRWFSSMRAESDDVIRRSQRLTDQTQLMLDASRPLVEPGSRDFAETLDVPPFWRRNGGRK